MTSHDDFDDALRDSREREEDAELEEEFNRIWPTMSEKEQAYWIGRLIRMLEDEGLRLH
jgi:hypothetical protein